MERLWLTHRILNERLPIVLTSLFQMRRGELGKNKRQRARFSAYIRTILERDAKSAYDPILKGCQKGQSGSAQKQIAALAEKCEKSIQKLNEKPTARRSADLATVRELKTAQKQYNLAAEAFAEFDKGVYPLEGMKLAFADLHRASNVFRSAVRSAVESIKSHVELTNLWEANHADWQRRKVTWENDHPEYLAVRQAFEDFETEVGGQIRGSAERWHLYLDWFKANPQLAGWRGAAEEILESVDLPKRTARKFRNNRNEREFASFMEGNPELKALHNLHKYYEREFVRRRKSKRNSDGFDHRPTFTLPDPVKHPRWYTFTRTSDTQYKNLRLPTKRKGMAEITLSLLQPRVEGGYEKVWVAVPFKADPRFADMRATDKDGEFLWYDRQLKKERKATFKGARLIFRNPGAHNQSAHLYFTVDIESEPLTDLAKTAKWIKTSRRFKVTAGTRTCAVDLGIRHIGFATVAAHEPNISIERSHPITLAEREPEGARHPGRKTSGPTLVQIRDTKRMLARQRRKRGKPVHGEKTNVELQEHLTNMSEDRFRKSARAIVNFAMGRGSGNRCDILLLESLTGLVPRLDQSRAINRSLMEFNRAHLVDWVNQLAEDSGLRVFELSPFGTSQVCWKCGQVGRRYSIVKNRETGVRMIKFGVVEKLFACECGYRANADHNASCNLHRRFVMGEDAVSAYSSLQKGGETQKKQFYKELDNLLQPLLETMHSLEPETPF